MEQGPNLTIKLIGGQNNLVGMLETGKGRGAGFYYAKLEDAQGNFPRRTARLKPKDDGELSLWLRDGWGGGGGWGPEFRATRSSTPSSCDAAIKLVGGMFRQLKVMYTFAAVASDKKWLPKDTPFDQVVQEMLQDAFKDEKGSFIKWYLSLTPPMESGGLTTKIISYWKKGLTEDEVLALLKKEMPRVLEKPEYLRSLRLCSESLNATLTQRLKDLTHAFWNRTKQRDFSQKLDVLDKERKEKEEDLQAAWRNALQGAMHCLAPEGAKRVTVHNMSSRTPSTIQLKYSMVTMGAPRLFCAVHGFKVEKDCFEHAVSQEIYFQPDLTRLADLELVSQEPIQVKSLGALGHDRVFALEYCDGGAGLKFFSHSRRTQQPQEVLHVKRPIHTVAFNENLRMLALHSAESKNVAVFTWDEQFTRHSEYCPPINLETYQENATLFEMHFLFEPKHSASSSNPTR